MTLPLTSRWWKQRPCAQSSSQSYPESCSGSHLACRSRHRSRTYALGAIALMVALAALSACATSPTGQTSATPPATATIAPTATATPRPKPTSVPTTSVAFCQGLLSVAEVNSVMQPPAPATTILFENDSSNQLNACSWTPGQNIAVLAVYFVPFPAGTSLTVVAQQLLTKSNAPAGGTPATTPVSGVGDQALYLNTTIPTPAGANYIAALYVADGAVLIACTQTGDGNVPAPAQSDLTQACTLVVSRL